MEYQGNHGQIFNIAVDEPITYEDAFQSYMTALNKAGFKYMKLRSLGKLSSIIEQMPGVTRWLCRKWGARFAFGIWRPGFDLTYSSKRLLSTTYRFKWNDFERIIASCIYQANSENS